MRVGVGAGGRFFAHSASRNPGRSGAWAVARGGGAAAGSVLLLSFPPPGEPPGGRARVGRLGARACWPPGLPGERRAESGAGFNMMAAEGGSEEGGPGAAGAAPSPRCRRRLSCPPWAPPAWEPWTKGTPWMDPNTRRKRWPSP